jgi:transcriptional regulator with XRE-family HTH domain
MTKSLSLPNQPHYETEDVTRRIGDNLRAHRIITGYSQEDIGMLLGVSYQQVQKYETGANRIAASKLWQCAQVLKIPVSTFFTGLENPDSTLENGLGRGRYRVLMQCLLKLDDRTIDRAILALVRKLLDQSVGGT